MNRSSIGTGASAGVPDGQGDSFGRLNAAILAQFGVEPGWRFGGRRQASWSEMDPFGHVNNIAYLVYFEDARNAYLEHCGLPRLSAQTPGPVLVESRQEYVRPLAHGDRILVTARTVGLGRTSLRMEYAVWRDGLIARGAITAVLMISATDRKVAIPPDLRASVERLEGRTLRARPR